MDTDSGVIITRPDGTPVIQDISQAYLRTRLTEFCYFFNDTGEDQEQVHPPNWLVRSIAERGHWPGLRLLMGVTEVPVLRRDGTILTEPGYDVRSQLLYSPSGETPEIPECPSRQEAMVAIAELKDLVCDFPFATDAHQSAWLSGVLTPLARYAFDGPAPLHLIDANVRGSGKSMLTDVISAIVTGRREMARFANAPQDEEMRKRLTALAMAGDSIILIDNIGGTFGGPSLDAALTSTQWKDRKLGASEIVSFPLRATWYATGNNVVLNADTSRRICHIRLRSELENPEDREGFKYPDLLKHVSENRERYVAAAITILRGYVVAGRPSQELKAWGSFQGWSDLVRSALVWAGEADPGETRNELRNQSDNDAAALRALVLSWVEVDPENRGLTAGELVKRLDQKPDQFHAVRESLLELTRKDVLSSRSIGRALSKFKQRVTNGHYIDCIEGRSNTKKWRVVSSSPIEGDNQKDADG